ncbi:vesicle-associated membrane protein 2 [Galendromus occidentalis]|uniref:Vesicle-associated membrane protein 2 n=1 Tax=Galendromus occidentalis TaxID=34638 RepID=A0AAJ6QXV4_9ACAR|nr:vesicle-associated membrane protein 2 [Galendromus occidentalis]
MATSESNNDKLEEVKQQVDDVVDIMHDNLKSVMQRGDNLTDLSSRADQLEENAKAFEKQAVTLKRKQWWQNMKMKIILGIILAVIIAIIIYLVL